MNLSLPLNFGERQCDRALLANFRVSPADAEMKSLFLWMCFMVWRDFGIARDDRRAVPLDAAERAESQTVAIIEQYIGWTGQAGGFVEAAIRAGFFHLVATTDTEADLVLVDFFPANRSEARQISNSRLGGISKGVNIARREAEAGAKEQLSLFEKTDSPVLRSHTRDQVKDALFLVHQICRILHRAPPVANEWRDALTEKALAVLTGHTDAERDVAFRWFAANRDAQEIPPRLDFILDQFATFVAKGRTDFG
jgi:hypothetical protein